MKSDLLKTMSLLFFPYLALFSRYKHLYIGNWIGLFPQILKKFSEGLRFDVTQLSSKFSPTFGKIIVCIRGLAFETSKMADQSSSGSINSGSFESSLFIRMSEFYPESSSDNSYAFWSPADILVHRPTDNVLPYQFEPECLVEQLEELELEDVIDRGNEDEDIILDLSWWVLLDSYKKISTVVW